MLAHLENGWQVDQAILSEEDKIVLIRFGHDWDPTCMKMDETLFAVAEKVKNFCKRWISFDKMCQDQRVADVRSR